MRDIGPSYSQYTTSNLNKFKGKVLEKTDDPSGNGWWVLFSKDLCESNHDVEEQLSWLEPFGWKVEIFEHHMKLASNAVLTSYS